MSESLMQVLTVKIDHEKLPRKAIQNKYGCHFASTGQSIRLGYHVSDSVSCPNLWSS